MGLKTFTFRIPKFWHGRITGQDVRAWVGACLSAPHFMAPVREDLTDRISLRLPAGLIQEFVQRTGLSSSEVLRRVIALGLRSAASLPPPLNHQITTKEPNTEIVSEELVGVDASGFVIIRQQDVRGFGYLRTLPLDRESYLKSRRA
jgi:hypothetical protein